MFSKYFELTKENPIKVLYIKHNPNMGIVSLLLGVLFLLLLLWRNDCRIGRGKYGTTHLLFIASNEITEGKVPTNGNNNVTINIPVHVLDNIHLKKPIETIIVIIYWF